MSKINWLKEHTKNGEFRGKFTREFSEDLSKECMLIGAILVKNNRTYNYTWTEGETAFDIFFNNGKYIGEKSEIIFTSYPIEFNNNQGAISTQMMIDYARNTNADFNTIRQLQESLSSLIGS